MSNVMQPLIISEGFQAFPVQPHKITRLYNEIKTIAYAGTLFSIISRPTAYEAEQIRACSIGCSSAE